MDDLTRKGTCYEDPKNLGHTPTDSYNYNNLHNNPLWNNRVQSNNRVGPGPKLGPDLDFSKLVDLEIWARGPWLKNSEPSYVSNYGPGRFWYFWDQK